MLNDQFSETPVNNSKSRRRSSVDLFFSENNTIIEEENEIIEQKNLEQQELAQQGRLGMIIDGTGAKLDQIQTLNQRLGQLGYDTAMVFVNTDLETALARNAKRTRTVPQQIATDSWKNVQKNIGKFQQIFDSRMFVIDNSEDSDVMQRIQEVEKTMRKFLSSPPSKKQALDWIQTQRP